MKHKHVWLTSALLVALATTTGVGEAQVARSKLVGTWYYVTEDAKENVDSYVFSSNGTYRFRAGREKSKSGNVAHSGTWRTLNGGRTLVLRTTRRTVLSAGKRMTIPASRTFRLSLAPAGDAVLIDGYSFGKY